MTLQKDTFPQSKQWKTKLSALNSDFDSDDDTKSRLDLAKSNKATAAAHLARVSKENFKNYEASGRRGSHITDCAKEEEEEEEIEEKDGGGPSGVQNEK